MVCLFLGAFIGGSSHAHDVPVVEKPDPSMPEYRIEAKPFEASETDIRAVLDSAGSQLWRYFPDYKIEKFVVQKGNKGPIVWYKRNDRGEIVMRLDTGELYWSQYAYQFSHEFLHILAQFDEDYAGNKWFEETLAETASLFCMRSMAREWKTNPPYSNWKSYSASLEDYAQDVIAKREKLDEQGMLAFYEKHKDTLRKTSTNRDLNGAMAVVLLQMFEERPQRWEAVRWLNSKPSPKGQTFEQYLQTWHDAVPRRHKTFVRQIADLYGISLSR